MCKCDYIILASITTLSSYIPRNKLLHCNKTIYEMIFPLQDVNICLEKKLWKVSLCTCGKTTGTLCTRKENHFNPLSQMTDLYLLSSTPEVCCAQVFRIELIYGHFVFPTMSMGAFLWTNEQQQLISSKEDQSLLQITTGFPTVCVRGLCLLITETFYQCPLQKHPRCNRLTCSHL